MFVNVSVLVRFQFVYDFSVVYTDFVSWGRNSYTKSVSTGDEISIRFLDIFGNPAVQIIEFDWFYKRIGPNAVRHGEPPNPLNSIGFISELDEFQSWRLDRRNHEIRMVL